MDTQDHAERERTVGFWRDEFSNLFPQFKNLTQLATELTQLADSKDESPEILSKAAYFAGVRGWKRLENVKRKKASLVVTADAVELMRHLRPLPMLTPTPAASRIARQNIVCKP